AFLGDVGAQALAEGAVQEVGGAVVEDDGGAAAGVDAGAKAVADGQSAAGEPADVAVVLAGKLAGVLDSEARGGGRLGRGGGRLRELAGVADLAAGFGVERAAVEEDDGFVAGFDAVDRAAVAQ